MFHLGLTAQKPDHYKIRISDIDTDTVYIHTITFNFHCCSFAAVVRIGVDIISLTAVCVCMYCIPLICGPFKFLYST